MATPSPDLIRVLRKTARRLRATDDYQWGHMGACNCGHLAQEITKIPRGVIHASALERVGDWEAQANAYCPNSGLLIDDIIGAMVDLGMTRGDIRDLEHLTNETVLRRMPAELRHPQRNNRAHVALYMTTWADLLQEELDAACAHSTTTTAA
jgi:hypothetical protein